MSAGEKRDGTEAQHTRLLHLNQEIRQETGEAYLMYAQHDGRHKYFFQGSDYAVIGIDSALALMELKHAEVFHLGPPREGRA